MVQACSKQTEPIDNSSVITLTQLQPDPHEHVSFKDRSLVRECPASGLHVQAAAMCCDGKQLQQVSQEKGLHHKPLKNFCLELLQGTRASRGGAASGQGSGQGFQEGARAPALLL